MSVGEKRTIEPTPEPTLMKTAENQGFKDKSVGVYDSAGKNTPFEDCFAACENISDEDIPQEFLRATPQEKSKVHEQISL